MFVCISVLRSIDIFSKRNAALTPHPLTKTFRFKNGGDNGQPLREVPCSKFKACPRSFVCFRRHRRGVKSLFSFSIRGFFSDTNSFAPFCLLTNLGPIFNLFFGLFECSISEKRQASLKLCFSLVLAQDGVNFPVSQLCLQRKRKLGV